MGVLANFKIRTKVLLALLPLAIMVVVAALYASIQIKSIDTAYSGLIEKEIKAYQQLTVARALNNRFNQYVYKEIAETETDQMRSIDADLDLTAAQFLVAAEEAKRRSPEQIPAIESVTTLFNQMVSDSRPVRAWRLRPRTTTKPCKSCERPSSRSGKKRGRPSRTSKKSSKSKSISDQPNSPTGRTAQFG